MHFFLFSDPCNEVACNVAGEKCEGGVCKCGSADSCEGKTTGAVCNAGSDVCECATGVTACSGGQTCSGVTCGMSLYLQYQ